MEQCDQPKSRIGRLEVETQLTRLGYRGRSGIEEIVLVLRRQPVLVLLLESGHP